MNTINKFEKTMASIGLKVEVKSGKVKNPNKKKVLCICRGGVSRSNAMASLLKYGAGHDAIAAGFEGNEPETLEMLFNWADVIVTMREFFQQYIPEQYRDKLRFIEVGEDIYFNPNPELYRQCAVWLHQQDDLRHEVLIQESV